MTEIKAEEVRIGIMVNVGGVDIHVSYTVMQLWLAGTVKLYAIPLTEDKLIELGFNRDYMSGYIGKDVGNSDFVLTEPLYLGEWQKGYAFEFSTGCVPKFKELHSVHELMNLYYDITGQDITQAELK